VELAILSDRIWIPPQGSGKAMAERPDRLCRGDGFHFLLDFGQMVLVPGRRRFKNAIKALQGKQS
jgi:hypothetical protein